MVLHWSISGHTFFGLLMTHVIVRTSEGPGTSSVIFERSCTVPDMGDTDPRIVLAQVLAGLTDEL